MKSLVIHPMTALQCGLIKRRRPCTNHSKLYGKIVLNCARNEVSGNPPHDSVAVWSNKQKDAVALQLVHLTKQFVAT